MEDLTELKEALERQAEALEAMANDIEELAGKGLLCQELAQKEIGRIADRLRFALKALVDSD